MKRQLVLAGLLYGLVVQAMSLHIGAFNMRIFGVSKVARSEDVAVIAKVIRRYDIVLLQEIRDISETSIITLLDTVNRDEMVYQYNLIVGPRLGRTRSKEQYAYMYRSETVLLLDQYTYNDTVEDIFEREPMVARIRDLSTEKPVADLVLIGIHIRPSDVVAELAALVTVYEQAAARYQTSNIILLGDMNADCRSLSNARYNDLTFSTDDRFIWLIDKEADTTVAVSSCSYDRFVVTAEVNATLVPDSVHIFLFDQEYNLTLEQAMSVSDHYPIELQLQGTESSTVGGNHEEDDDDGGSAVSTC